LWEERKPLEALYRIRDAQEDLDSDEPRGKRVFAAQYQQNPSDVSISLYDEAWLEPFDQQSLPWSLDRMTVRIDTAQKALGKNDHTGMVTFGHDRRDGNELFILDVDRARKEFPDLVEWIVAHCKRLWLLQTGNLKFTQITIEDANIGAALLAVLKLRLRAEKVFVRVELTKKYGSKFDRALEATPYFQQGRVRICDERLTYTHKKRPEETELEGIKAFRDEFRTFNEADTHTSDDTLDPVVWEVVSKWGGAKKNTRFR
jgi:phage terminase large subunit-like protein